MNPQRRRQYITIGIAVLLVALPCVWLARQYRQVKLNRALIAAANRCNADMVDRLLAQGANPNTRDTPQQRQTISWQLHHLLYKMPDPSQTAIMCVLISGSAYEKIRPPGSVLRIVKALIDRGANVNAPMVNGYSALMCSSCVRDIGVVKALIAAHADVNAKDISGSTALSWAAYNGNTEAVKLLAVAGADMTGYLPLVKAIQTCHTDTFKALIAAHADVNARDSMGRSMLIYAVANRNTDAVIALTQAHADVNARDGAGKTAISYATAHYQVDVAALLRKAGARE